MKLKIMSEPRNWIIIDIRTKLALYGFDNITMQFSSKEVATEVSQALFKDMSDCLIIELNLKYQ